MKPAVLLIAIAALLAPAAGAQMGQGAQGDPLFDSGNIATGTSFSWTFNETGTFGYHCKIHPSMKGTVQVAAAGTATGAVAIVTSKYAPPSITIGKGGSVSWTNADAFAHTVTSND